MRSKAGDGASSASAERDVRRPATTDPGVHRKRIERVARKLFQLKFEGARGLWSLQLELLGLQRDIQAAITLVKSQRPRDSAWAEKLSDLKWVRWHARTLGDTFAWLLLGLDRQVIGALSDNERVAIQQDDHGSRGVEVIATHLGNQGWGFPMLHDITDCLRIGDVTFIDFGEARRERRLRTVEIKTRLKDERPDENGGQLLNYEVTLFAYLHRADDLIVSPADDAGEPERRGTVPADLPPKPAKNLRRTDPRLTRQLERMDRALTKLRAGDDGITEVQGEPPLITAVIQTSANSYWKNIRRVVRKARQTGIAAEMVEPGLLYVAMYNADGITKETLPKTTPSQLVPPEMLPREWGGRNALAIHMVPAGDHTQRNLFLPYFLYSMPKAWIYDLLHGRLVIAVIHNPAFLVDGLERAGFKVRPNPSDPRQLIVRVELDDDAGYSYAADFHAINWHVHEAILEFKSMQFVVDAARGIRESVRGAWEQRERLDEIARSARGGRVNARITGPATARRGPKQSA